MRFYEEFPQPQPKFREQSKFAALVSVDSGPTREGPNNTVNALVVFITLVARAMTACDSPSKADSFMYFPRNIIKDQRL